MKKCLTIIITIAIAISLFTACAKTDKPPTAAELLALGEKYLLEMDYEQAIVAFEQLIEIEPMNPRGYTGAAEAYAANGQEIQARRILRRGANLLPDDREISAALDKITADSSGGDRPAPSPTIPPQTPVDVPALPMVVTNVIVLQIGNPYMTVNDAVTQVDANGNAPLMRGGSSMLPLRGVLTVMGGEVAYDSATDGVTATLGDDKVVIPSGSNNAVLNGSELALPIAPQTIGGSLYVPTRLFADAFGASIGWDSDSQSITLTYEGIAPIVQAVQKPTDSAVAAAYLKVLQDEGAPTYYSWGNVEKGVIRVSIIDLNNDDVPELIYSRAAGEYNARWDVIVYSFVGTECREVIYIEGIEYAVSAGGFEVYAYEGGGLVALGRNGAEASSYLTSYVYRDITAPPITKKFEHNWTPEYEPGNSESYLINGAAVSQSEYERDMDNLYIGTKYRLTSEYGREGTTDVSMQYEEAIAYLQSMQGGAQTTAAQGSEAMYAEQLEEFRRQVNSGEWRWVEADYAQLDYQYALHDIDGNGVKEFIKGYGENILEIGTMVGGNYVHLGGWGGIKRECRLIVNNIISADEGRDASSGAHAYYRISADGNSLRTIFALNYDFDREAAGGKIYEVTDEQGTVSYYSNEEYQALRSRPATTEVPLNWQPLF